MSPGDRVFYIHYHDRTFYYNSPKGVYEHVVDKKNTSQKQVKRSSEVRKNHLCLVHQTHLITPTKYELVGNLEKEKGGTRCRRRRRRERVEEGERKKRE